MSVTIFGVRHHGPGSARALVAALEQLQPDALLIEGPPDANHLIPLVMNEALVPPVALLIYAANDPKRAAWYPFAHFSPEWQALRYGQTQGIHTAFMDLPQWHMLALEEGAAELASQEAEKANAESTAEQTEAQADTQAEAQTEGEPVPAGPLDPAQLWRDPLKSLATLAGYEDGEQWWGALVEERAGSIETFTTILAAMSELRAAAGLHPNPIWGALESAREAWMRTVIRAAEARFDRIAVVCGAWHAPALQERDSKGEAAQGGYTKSDDAKLLKKLPTIKTEATFAPWTYSRLARASGYGAGINSPGWYEHLWTTPTEQVSERWLARVAALLRSEGLNASTAQVIDAVRLTDALVALRERSHPTLAEMNEASLAVFCQSDASPLQLIERQLIIGDRFGRVPDEIPAVPLQRDVEAQRKKLRLKVSELESLLDLDLRNETDLARSHFFHRLALLKIQWATLRHTPQSGASSYASPARGAARRTTGTFHEFWEPQWRPEAAIQIIEASVWGNTVQDAAESYVRDRVAQLEFLPELTATLDHVLLANLPDAANTVVARLQEIAALTTDTGLLMDALPALADLSRYGNVRQTDQSLVANIVGEIITRICVGLPQALHSLDDDAAQVMYKRLLQVQRAISLLQDAAYNEEWRDALRILNEQQGLHGLLAGRVVRLLRDDETLQSEAVVAQMGLALSTVNGPEYAAAWLDGFLRDSGEVLIYDDDLWALLNAWVKELRAEHFEQLLPLLRRTFATFHAPDRKRIGERAKQKAAAVAPTAVNIDPERAALVLPIFKQLLGLSQ